MPANREARLLARQALESPYFLLTFHHPEVAREARAGQFVMIKAGVSARAAAAAALLDPVRRRGRRVLHASSSRPSGRAAAPWRPSPWARSRSAWGLSASPSPPPAPRRRRCSSRAATASRPSASSPRGSRGRAAGSSTGAAPLATCSCASSSSPWGSPRRPPPRTASLGAQGPGDRGRSSHLEARDGAGAALCLRARRHAARGGAPGRGARPARRGQPRPLDGLRHRHLPGLRGAHPGRGRGAPRYRCACTEGPVFDAARVVWRGRARGDGARRLPMSLAVELGGLRLRNPFIAASGHLRLRGRVRRPAGSLESWAASSPRASTSSRGTAAPRRASWRRPRGC